MKCAFCLAEVEPTHSGCIEEYQARLANMQHIAQDILNQKNSIPGFATKLPKLSAEIDKLNLAGANLAKVYVERTRLANDLALKMVRNEDAGKAISDFQKHIDVYTMPGDKLPKEVDPLEGLAEAK